MTVVIPEYRQGDTWPPITGTITDGSGSPVDISTATSLSFIAVSGATTITGVPTNLDDGTTPNMGKWSYTWGATDLSVAGSYKVEIPVTWETGKIESFPSNAANAPTFLVS